MFPKFDPVGETIKKCPFLHALVMTQGETFAREVAENFSKPEPVVKDKSPAERLTNVAENFTLCHGQDGLLPLAAPPRLATPLPMASISLSGFMGDFNPFRFNSKGKKKPQKAKSQKPPSSGNPSSGKCPMRRILGPLATAVMSQRYHCPKPIVMMRAAIAKTSVVRALRPESIEIKLLAVALASSLLNIPFGMIREHTRKFSPQWFLVVHATIPFIAMFRKAVIMPPYAILFTVAAAIGGQAVGAKAERRRLEWVASQTDEESQLEEWMPAASMTTPRISA